MCLAISYQRWSSDRQNDGDSRRRQTAMAVEFCKRHKLTLLPITAVDAGVSGWKSKNSTEGELSSILEALSKGKIEQGTVLVVEQLDRITRDETDIAVGLIGKIIRGGMPIGHCRKDRILTKADLKGITILEFVLELILANEDNNKKSERIRASMNENKTLAITEKKIWTAKGPAWLKLNESRTAWEVLEDEAKKVFLIYRWCIKGMGTEAICKKLVQTGIAPMPGTKWNRGYILQILRSRIACGDYQPDKRKGGKQVIADYYTRIIDDATYYQAQKAMDARLRLGRGRNGEKFINLLSGLCIDHDSQSPIWLAGKPQRDGTVQKRIYPSGSKHGKGKYWSMPLEYLEKAVLGTVRKATFDDSPSEDESNLKGLEAKAETLKTRIAKINTTIADTPDFDSAIATLKTLDAALKATAQDIETLRAKLSEKPHDALQECKRAIKSEDRLLIRAKLLAMIAKIEISAEWQVLITWLSGATAYFEISKDGEIADYQGADAKAMKTKKEWLTK